MHRKNAFVLTVILTFLFAPSAIAAEKSTAPQLIELAKSNSPALKDAITNTLDAKELKEGTAWIAHGPDFFFAIETSSKPSRKLMIQSRLGVRLPDFEIHLKPTNTPPRK